MSRFEDILGKQKPEPAERPKGKIVEFYVDCFECGEEVTEVEYFPNEDSIFFVCSHGHKNLIEKFGVTL